MGTKDQGKISIIVLNRNGKTLLKGFLESFLVHNCYPNFEFIVVDHASNDGSRELVRAFANRLPVRLMESEVNHSFASANNRAGEQATGQYLFFVNNDITFQTDILAQFVSYLENPAVGIVGVKLLYPPHHALHPGAVQHVGIKFAEDLPDGSYRPYEIGVKSGFTATDAAPQMCPAVTGAALLCRRAEFLRVGGFCEDYWYGYEDVDLCLTYASRLKKGSLAANDLMLIHDESTTRKLVPADTATQQRLRNQTVLKKRYGYALTQAVRKGLVTGNNFWSEAKLVLALAVTEVSPEAKAGDYFTALELAWACSSQLGWEIRFLARNEDWYDLSGVDVLVVLVDAYDLTKIHHAKPSLVRISWLRNWFDRWTERPSFDHYDIYLCSSQKAADGLREQYGKAAHVFPLATNDQRFTSDGERLSAAIDYCFTGNRWNVGRELEKMLDPRQLKYTFALYGAGWEENVAFRSFWKGFLPYAQLPTVYRATKIIVDDANHVTKPWGSVNSRVFDALGCGAMVVTNGDIGAEELFGGKLPTYRTAEELHTLLNFYLSNEEARRTRVEELRQVVLENHTYTKRAAQLQSILQDYCTNKFRIAMKLPETQTHNRQRHEVHLADSLQQALVKFGHTVRLDFFPQWDGPLSSGDNVVLVFPGSRAYQPKPGLIHLLWDVDSGGTTSGEEWSLYDYIVTESPQRAEELQQQHALSAKVLSVALAPTGGNPNGTQREEMGKRSEGEHYARVLLQELSSVENTRHFLEPLAQVGVQNGQRITEPLFAGGDTEPEESVVSTKVVATLPTATRTTLSPQEEELYCRALRTEIALPEELLAQLTAFPQTELISIVTPTHNRAYVLSHCIQSVLAQTYKNFELIIVDDASTDNTRQLVESFQASDQRILYAYKPKTNVSDTRNVGLRLARGRYIAFLDSDSVWDRNFLLMMFHSLSTAPRHEKVAYCDASLFEKGVARGSPSVGWNAKAFRSKPFIDLCTVFAELSAVREVGLFDVQMTKWVDYEILLRLNNRFGDFLHVSQPLLSYFRLVDGLSLAPEAQVPMRTNMEIIWNTKLAGLQLAYVLNDFPALSQTFVVKEIAHLRHLGVDVMVFHRIHPDRSAEIPDDLPVYQFETRADLIRLLEDHHRNYMHTHFAYPMPPEFVLPTAEATQCPFTFMPHAVDIFLKLNASRNRLALVANSPFCRGVFALGVYHRQFFINQGVAAEKTLILRPYCDEQEFWQDELRPLEKVGNVVSISRFQEKKGFSFLLQAFRKLRHPEVTLRIYGYGQGSQTDELQALAAGDSRIQILPGLSTAEEVKEVLDTADLFVLPCIETKDGDKDGIPTVLREAMAAGVPVLTTPISSIPDLVRHGSTGFVADPGNVKSLLHQLEEVMDLSSTQLLSIRKAAQERILRGFSKDLTINTLLEVWKKG